MRSRRRHWFPVERSRFLKQTRQIVGWIAGGLALFFGFLQLKDIDTQSVFEQINPIVFWHITLAAYYLSWVRGTLNDVDIQEVVYIQFPHDKWPIQAIMVVLCLAVLAAALCWAEGDLRRFSMFLLLFTLIDHYSWQYLIRYLRGSNDTSERIYRENREFFRLEALLAVINQVQGNWKWYRFCGGLVIITAMLILSFSPRVRGLLVNATEPLTNGLPAKNLLSITECILVLFWVLLMEVWHWYIRIRTLVSLHLLEDLSVKYRMQPGSHQDPHT